MGLNEDINQKEFKNEWEKALINILYTHGWVTAQIKGFLSAYGVTMQQYNVLRILNGAFPEPISTSVIRDRMLDKMSDASRIVDRLCTKGYASRQKNKDDRRLVDVMISSSGQALLKKINDAEEVSGETLNILSEKEAKELSRILDKIREQ